MVFKLFLTFINVGKVQEQLVPFDLLILFIRINLFCIVKYLQSIFTFVALKIIIVIRERIGVRL